MVKCPVISISSSSFTDLTTTLIVPVSLLKLTSIHDQSSNTINLSTISMTTSNIRFMDIDDIVSSLSLTMQEVTFTQNSVAACKIN
jgi:hypothetical protein